MKKILTASLVAMMAVSAANADIASTNYVEDRTGEFTEQGGQLIGDYAGQGQELKNIANTDTLTKAIGKLDAAIDSVAGGDVVITDKKIAENMLQDNSVSTRTIQDSAVTTAKIADGNVTEGKLATDSVTTAKIKNGAVTDDKLAEGAAVANIGYTPEDLGNKLGIVVSAENLTDDQWADVDLYPSMGTATKMIDYKIATNADEITAEISNVSNAKVSIDQTAQNANKAMITDAQGKVTAGQITTGMIEDGKVTEAKLEQNVQDALDLARSSIQGFGTLSGNTTGSGVVKKVTQENGIVSATASKVVNGDIEDGTIAKGKLVQEVQNSLTKADAALPALTVSDAAIASDAANGNYVFTAKKEGQNITYYWELIGR